MNSIKSHHNAVEPSDGLARRRFSKAKVVAERLGVSRRTIFRWADILAMPLSFKGRLIQYAGRLHRDHEGKSSARIYDYLDANSPLTRAMFRRRQTDGLPHGP